MILVASMLFGFGEAAASATFSVTSEDGSFDVAFDAPPKQLLRLEDRVCRLLFGWNEGQISAVPTSCSKLVAPDAVRAIESGTIQGTNVAASQVALGEVWLVYPFDVHQEVRAFIKPSPEATLHVASGIDALPFAIRSWTFFRQPVDVPTPLERLTCHAHVEAEPGGRVVATAVDACDEPYLSATRQTLESWWFWPPQIHGSPLPTALTLHVTYGAIPDESPWQPSASARQRWESGAHASLTAQERQWFIRTSTDRDLFHPDTATIRVTLPARATGAGSHYGGAFGDRTTPEVVALPHHPPLFSLVDVADNRNIDVYNVDLPALASTANGQCEILVQVDGHRRTRVWINACDADLREPIRKASSSWLAAHDGSNVDRARFHARVRYDDGRATMAVDEDALRTMRAALPDPIRSFRKAKLVKNEPPRWPESVQDQDLDCRVVVTLSSRGKPHAIQPAGCPDDLFAAASRAVSKWRWRPASEDGRDVGVETVVAVRYRP